MRKWNFDKRIFNWGYALVYTILQYILGLGFSFAVIMVVLNMITGATVTIPDVLLNVVAVYILISIVGFPLVSVIKVGFRRLAMWSTVSYDGKTIKYDKMADRLWTAVGHVEEHHVYTISHIESITVTQFSYIVKGTIRKVVINNGRKLKSSDVDTVKIPKAYSDMEMLRTISF